MPLLVPSWNGRITHIKSYYNRSDINDHDLALGAIALSIIVDYITCYICRLSSGLFTSHTVVTAHQWFMDFAKLTSLNKRISEHVLKIMEFMEQEDAVSLVNFM